MRSCRRTCMECSYGDHGEVIRADPAFRSVGSAAVTRREQAGPSKSCGSRQHFATSHSVPKVGAYFTDGTATMTREMNGGSDSSSGGCGGSGRKRPRTGTMAATNRSLLIAAGALAVASTSSNTCQAASAAELEVIPPLQMQQVEDTSGAASESLPVGIPTAPVVVTPARKCDRDNPSYESRLGLSCSEHVEWFDPSQTLEVGSSPCDAYAIIGFAPDEVAALKWHCPRSCDIVADGTRGLSSAESSATGGAGTDGDDESSCWYDEKSRSSNTYMLHGVNNNAGLSDDDPDHVVDILHSPTFGDGGDDGDGDNNIRGRRNDRQRLLQRSCYKGWPNTCQDNPFYHSKMRVPCWRHTTLDCTAFGHIGYTDEEILDLIESCPCSCGVECGTFSVAPSASPSATPSDRPTGMPSSSPSISFEPSTKPSARPSQSPSDVPSSKPSVHPTGKPSTTPTVSPSLGPSSSPSNAPSSSPSAIPSGAPSRMPSLLPTTNPTYSPSNTPSQSPTMHPTIAPSSRPSISPTIHPTQSPTKAPTPVPSPSPTFHPTPSPTMAPSSLPSAPPTPLPTKMPSAKPSASPTRSFQPSQIPTVAPDLISWTTTQSGLLKDDRFGWHISDKGLTLTFIAEKSENCFEGSNANEQKGTASARIFVPEGKRLALNYTLGGVGESLDSGYEEMILFIDGVRMASSTSQAIGIECSTSPVLTTYEVEPPYIMKSGIYQLRVGFSTFDDFDHYGIEYMIQFAFL